jgi:hypothetical protein
MYTKISRSQSRARTPQLFHAYPSAVYQGAAAEARAARIREAKAGRMIRHTLDPLLRHLTAHYIDNADLSDRLQRLFKVAAGRQQRGGGAGRCGGLGDDCRQQLRRELEEMLNSSARVGALKCTGIIPSFF